MKKILLISDTHFYNEIFDSFNTNDYDYCIHCGDSSLEKDSPYLKDYYVVEGNHDQKEMFPIELILEIEGHRIFITHGQYYDVYLGYEVLYKQMVENNCDICFHGHTHVPYFIQYKNKTFINPGSTMMNRGEIGIGTYAVITFNNNDMSLQYYDCDHHSIPLSLIEKNAKILDEFKDILKK